MSAARKQEVSENPDGAIDVASQYIAVPRTQILARENAISDLYVRLGTGKMVKVAHKDTPIDRERIQRLGKKSVESLYVLDSDFSHVVRDLLADTRHLAKSAPNDVVVEQYMQVAEAVLTEVVQLPLSDESIARAAEVSQEICEKMVQTTDLSKGIRMIFTLAEPFGRHALGTVVVANWIAHRMGWTSPRALFPVTMGSLLHDVGKRELPADIVGKRRSELTQEELAIYETHPTRGTLLLGQQQGISADILRIVQEHHEIPNGQGFPNRLRGERMFPLAKVVSLANVLSHEIIDPLMEKRQLDIAGISEKIDTIYKGMYGNELIKAARQIFNK